MGKFLVSLAFVGLLAVSADAGPFRKCQTCPAAQSAPRTPIFPRIHAWLHGVVSPAETARIGSGETAPHEPSVIQRTVSKAGETLSRCANGICPLR